MSVYRILFAHAVKKSAWSTTLDILVNGFAHGSSPYGTFGVNADKDSHLISNYDGGAAVIFDSCSFAVDISRYNAAGKKRKNYPAWISDNPRAGAVAGVVYMRRMNKFQEWIHHKSSIHVRAVVVNKRLLESWLQTEYVEREEGREWIKEAVCEPMGA